MRAQDHKDQEAEGTLPERTRCSLQEMDELIIRDIGGALATDGRWPLLIDLSKQAATFFRYRDVNYISAASPKDTESDALRLALLGAIRYGKPLVIDLLDVDLWDTMVDRFNAIAEGLMEAIVTQEILNKEWYESLIKESDGDAYKPVFFTDDRLAHFKILWVTTLRFPDPNMIDQCFPIEVVPRGGAAREGRCRWCRRRGVR